jgi:hypothetical protein
MDKDVHKVFKEMVKIQAHKKTTATLDRTLQALSEMKANNLVINFNSLANYAKVTKAWLYRNADIRKEILGLRDQIPIKKRSTDLTRVIAKKGAEVDKLKQKIITLENINKKLREQLEVVYGELHKKTST